MKPCLDNNSPLGIFVQNSIIICMTTCFLFFSPRRNDRSWCVDQTMDFYRDKRA